MDKEFSENAVRLLKGLLCREPRIRLGASKSDSEEIKEHPFFSGIDWIALAEGRLAPPLYPAAAPDKYEENEKNKEYEWFSYVDASLRGSERHSEISQI